MGFGDRAGESRDSANQEIQGRGWESLRMKRLWTKAKDHVKCLCRGDIAEDSARFIPDMPPEWKPW